MEFTVKQVIALPRILKYISRDNKSFIILQFNYCPVQLLVWMCHGRGLKNKINKLHEQALRTVYQG